MPTLAWEPKTKSSRRTVPIPAAIGALLVRLEMETDGSPYVFLTCRRLHALKAKHGNAVVPSGSLVNNFTRDYNAIQRAAGDITQATNWPLGTFHDLRKSFGTRAAAASVPMPELQAHMGHSSITTTAEYYVEVEAAAAGRLRSVFAAL